MKQTRILALLIAIGCVASSILLYKNHQKKNRPLPYKTENPQKRTIQHIISTLGVLELKEIMKIGSIQAGLVKEIYVKEGEHVQKDQVLAFIDTAKNNSEVHAAEHRVQRAQAEVDYQTEFFARQQSLYDAKQLSKNAYQQAAKDLNKSIADLKTEEALLRRFKLEFESTYLRAPDDGFVTGIYASKGMIANDVSNITLFEIAKNITQMQVILDIDESEVGSIKKNQKVTLIPNSFPEMRIKSRIAEISYTPKSYCSGYTQTQQNAFSYKALADIDNSSDILRPGMLVNASISVHKAKDIISISGLSFYLNQNIIEKIAQKINYSISAISKKEQKRIIKSSPEKVIKFVWIINDKSFKQQAISVGTTDNMFWEVIDGLSINDNVIIDVEEPNEMKDVYARWFKGSL